MALLAIACDTVRRAKRARRMAQCGAYRKGMQSLWQQVAQLTQAQQLLYANLLLPGAPDDLQHKGIVLTIPQH